MQLTQDGGVTASLPLSADLWKQLIVNRLIFCICGVSSSCGLNSCFCFAQHQLMKNKYWICHYFVLPEITFSFFFDNDTLRIENAANRRKVWVAVIVFESRSHLKPISSPLHCSISQLQIRISSHKRPLELRTPSHTIVDNSNIIVDYSTIHKFV